MRHRRLLQAVLSLPITPFLAAQDPVVQKPALKKPDELPKLEASNPEQAGYGDCGAIFHCCSVCGARKATIMALAMRASEYLAGEMKAGNL